MYNSCFPVTDHRKTDMERKTTPTQISLPVWNQKERNAFSKNTPCRVCSVKQIPVRLWTLKSIKCPCSSKTEIKTHLLCKYCSASSEPATNETHVKTKNRRLRIKLTFQKSARIWRGCGSNFVRIWAYEVDCHCNFGKTAVRCVKRGKAERKDEVWERWTRFTVSLQLYFYPEDVPVPLHPLLFVLSSSPSLSSRLCWLHSEFLHKSATQLVTRS